MKIKILLYLAIVSLLVCSCCINDYSDKISNALTNQLGKESKRLRDAVLFYLSLSSTFALKKTWLLPIFLIL